MHLCLCVFKQWFSFGLPPSVLNIAMNKKNIKGESLQQRFKCGRWAQGCDHMFKKKTTHCRAVVAQVKFPDIVFSLKHLFASMVPPLASYAICC